MCSFLSVTLERRLISTSMAEVRPESFAEAEVLRQRTQEEAALIPRSYAQAKLTQVSRKSCARDGRDRHTQTESSKSRIDSSSVHRVDVDAVSPEPSLTPPAAVSVVKERLAELVNQTARGDLKERSWPEPLRLEEKTRSFLTDVQAAQESGQKAEILLNGIPTVTQRKRVSSGRRAPQTKVLNLL